MLGYIYMREQYPGGWKRIPYSEPEKLNLADELDAKVGLYMGDTLLTAFKLFSNFELVQSVRIEFRKDLDVFVGGVDSLAEPVVALGLNNSLVTDGLRSRIIKRFGLPTKLFDAPASLFRPFIFAHELGHVAQADPKFRELFGEIDKTVYDPSDNYAAYVESDKEANADYIGSMIVAASQLGLAARYSPPKQDPPQWRDWAREHRVID